MAIPPGSLITVHAANSHNIGIIESVNANGIVSCIRGNAEGFGGDRGYKVLRGLAQIDSCHGIIIFNPYENNCS